MTLQSHGAVLPSHLSWHVTERKLLVYRRTWWALIIGLLQPVLYLVGVGVGVGALVGTISFGGQELEYLAYVTPGLMAAAAMNGALDEVISSLLWELRESKVHDVTLASPVQPADLAAGEVLAALLRGSAYSGFFLIISWAMGAILSPWAVLALPAAVLIGATFGCVGSAITTYLRMHSDIGLVQVVLLPLLLFSATFFPASVYPTPLRILAELSPLTRSANLLRSLTTGQLQWSMVADVAYLCVLATFAFWIAGRRLDSQMRT